MNVYEIIAFMLYLVAMLTIGISFFIKDKAKSEKDYFLGGRNMSGWVAALSAGASDMSAWCLMGLPGAIYLSGLGQVWISVGLIIGTILAWIFVAPRLRVYAMKADDSITVPQFLTNRFMSKSSLLRIVCAIVFVIAYCIYMASSLVACGGLVNMLSGGKIDAVWGMVIAGLVIVVYTMLGGFNAVCWTDFVQGMLMLGAIMILPIIMAIFMKVGSTPEGYMPWISETPNYFNVLSSGSFDWKSISDILSGLGWGLGYFGMPHIIIRYMSIKDKKEMRKSQIVGSSWTFAILVMATVFALVAHSFLGASGETNSENIFVLISRAIFNKGALALIGGVLISAVVAASMSTADSQLLLASSAFATDIYKAKINPNANDKQMNWISRIVVIVISAIAFVIALLGTTSFGATIMSLVDNAWAILGAAFGSVIIFSLYWKRFNYKGCVAGIIAGAVVTIIWLYLPLNAELATLASLTNLYAIIPGFIASLIASVAVTLNTEEPSAEVVALFDEMVNSNELKYDVETLDKVEA